MLRWYSVSPASLFIIAQIVYAVFILGVSAQPKILQQAKHEVKNVLGVSMLAQDTTPPPDTVAPPADQTTTTEAPPAESSVVAPPSATDTPQPPPPNDSSQPEPSGIAPSSAPAVSETPSPTASSQPESPGVSPTPEETPTSSPTTNPEDTTAVSPSPKEAVFVTPSPTLAPLESSVAQTEAVLNPENVVNDTEHIDKTSVDEVKKEEDSISQAQTSDAKAKLLITFAQNKMNDIEKNLKQDDFATTAFATTRLTDMIDRTTQEIQSAPAAQSAELTQKVSDFCQQADLALRNQELVVPEASEQDMEISRAKCFEYR